MKKKRILYTSEGQNIMNHENGIENLDEQIKKSFIRLFHRAITKPYLLFFLFKHSKLQKSSAQK